MRLHIQARCHPEPYPQRSSVSVASVAKLTCAHTLQLEGHAAASLAPPCPDADLAPACSCCSWRAMRQPAT